MTDTAPVLIDTTGSTVVIRLNRPRVRNAIDDAMQDLLLDILDDVAANASLCAVVVTGEGKGFCAGGDISGMQRRLSKPPDQVATNGLRRLAKTRRLVTTLHRLDKVTIAAVNGPATGIGMDLALCCDFIIAAPEATFAMSYTRVGLVPDGGGMYLLPRRVGLAQAKQLVFSGRAVDASEAHQLGIVDRVVPAAELVSSAVAWAEELTAGSAVSTSLAKAILDQTFDLTLDEVLARSHEAQAICYTTEAHRNLVARFLNRPRQQTAKTHDDRSVV